MYGIFSDEKIDLGHVVWALTTKSSETSCARFLTIFAKNYWDHYRVPQAQDIRMDEMMGFL